MSDTQPVAVFRGLLRRSREQLDELCLLFWRHGRLQLPADWDYDAFRQPALIFRAECRRGFITRPAARAAAGLI